MHQSLTPSLSKTIWPRWASRLFLSLPIVQILLPVTFGYFLSSRKTLEAVVMRQLRWKKLWWRSLTCSHKRTSMGPSRSCWNGTLGVPFQNFMCVLSIKVPIRKKSGNFFNDPCRLLFLCFLIRRLILRVHTQEAKKNIRLKKTPSNVYTVLGNILIRKL